MRSCHICFEISIRKMGQASSYMIMSFLPGMTFCVLGFIRFLFLEEGISERRDRACVDSPRFLFASLWFSLTRATSSGVRIQAPCATFCLRKTISCHLDYIPPRNHSVPLRPMFPDSRFGSERKSCMGPPASWYRNLDFGSGSTAKTSEADLGSS